MGLNPLQDVNTTYPVHRPPPQQLLEYRPMLGTDNLLEGIKTQESVFHKLAVGESAGRERLKQVSGTETMTHAQPCSVQASDEHETTKAGGCTAVPLQQSLADIARCGVWRQPATDENG
ncbi:unnamed protein product [Parnassius apollo]|uniref:(apollo) hypothetical protein n=1 Tax=Parnassius apollo TaxID=110799 RepID=A0A8S3WN40_PARAO|nr:unnamed protein product [Parnassius apollo]